MSELKPCPFCGGRQTYRKHDGGVWLTTTNHKRGCIMRDALAFVAFNTEAEAVAAWNTRAERTCEDVNEEDNDFTCSECGASMYTQIDDCWTMIARGGLCDDVIEKPNYCPNCGAKVIE